MVATFKYFEGRYTAERRPSCSKRFVVRGAVIHASAAAMPPIEWASRAMGGAAVAGYCRPMNSTACRTSADCASSTSPSIAESAPAAPSVCETYSTAAVGSLGDRADQTGPGSTACGSVRA
eukprot:4645837-Prymnesium_polylepis.1